MLKRRVVKTKDAIKFLVEKQGVVKAENVPIVCVTNTKMFKYWLHSITNWYVKKLSKYVVLKSFSTS